MILALIILQLSVLVAANPFHKYPFVFLLDVGNEELEKTNTEQIRLNVPGGSVALRYPAIGNGNTIGHIRVSGIDFGTDLKANIVDGGPGYKYVVLVFMGNQGVPYDAVVTVQTVNDGDLNPPDISGSVSDTEGYQTQEDVNNSAEDLSDDSPVTNTGESGISADVDESNIQMNAEQMQSSSNVYKYAQSESVENGDGYDEEIVNHGSEAQKIASDDEQDDDELKPVNESVNDSDADINLQYSDNIEETNEPYNQKGEESDDDDNGEETSQLGPSPAEEIPNEDVYSYDNLRQRFNGEAPENAEQSYSKPDYQQEPLDYEDPEETQPIFNDGESHSSYKYQDSNNNNYNNIDSDDSYAVAY
ncbi:unnamed protein product [Chrysodeixis includens]|uniref:Uncharacterized protein n=1 Tax=Chrysodeixis includens TaxID=689277 RepID=A0A9P0BW91_CHRIL|nr:unnamed protein product [Chrysodeixis includens]